MVTAKSDSPVIRTNNGARVLVSEGKRPNKRARTDLIKSLNSLSNAEFSQIYLQMDLDCASFCIKHKTSDEITKVELDSCLKLIERTSAHDYKASSIGWDSVGKLKEMADVDMHYLLVHNAAHAAVNDTASFSAFLSFMLTYDSSPSVPVLYVYEIHLVEQHRKHGLGKHLMNLAFAIARSTGMSKVMLTCFVSNTHALAFYKRLGFDKDVVSPDDRRTRGRVIEPDYVIMSKDVTIE